MSIIRLLTRRHLMANRARTIVTVCGIAISVAMITAVFVAVASFFHYFGQLALYSDGDAQATFYHLTGAQTEALKADERIARVGLRGNDESCSGFRLAGEGSLRIRTGNLYTGDAANLAQMISCRYDGVLPSNSSEAAVEESFLLRNGLAAEPGQTITIQTGHRTWDSGSGEIKTYTGNYQEEELWEPSGTETLTVTAVLHGNPGTRNAKIVRGLSAEEAAQGDGRIAAMISLKNISSKSSKMVDEIAAEYGLTEYTKNDEYLDSVLCVREGSTLQSMLPLLSVILAIIIAASVVLIYNAFAMSLTEKVRYLGMLASVGATRKQKRYSVYYEGFLLGAVGIPLGFLAGVGGIAVTLKVVSRMIVGSDMIPALEENPGMVVLKTVVPPVVIPFILLFSVVTIFIAAYVPARKASRIMPIDAIRQTQEIRVKGSRKRCPRLIPAVFGYEGELAYRNMQRNPAKSRLITISITASVILFLSVSTFCGLFWASSDSAFFLPFDVIACTSYAEGDALLAELKELSAVEEVYPINMIIFEYDRQSEDTADLAFLDPANLQPSYRKKFAEKMNVDLRLLSDEDFDRLCEQNGLDRSRYYGDTLRAALCSTVTYDGRGKEVFTERVIGQVLKYNNKEKFTEAEVEIADFVKWEPDEHLYGMYAKNRATAFAPLSTYVQLLYHGNAPEGFTMDLAIHTADQALVYEQVQDILDSGRYHSTFCQNITDDTSTMAVVVYILQIFSYGFIALILLITVANIINSISTGIHLRRKEFAMLKSVGMTQGGFMKMIRLETLLYGFRSLLVGIPVSLLLGYLMTASLKDGIPYTIDPWSYLGVIAAVFGLLGLTMAASVAKLKDQGIVDTLKQDIF